MNKEVSELNGKTFDSFVSNGVSVVDFWAEWCGPCKMMAPHFDAAAVEMKGKAKFAKVNVDDESELAERFEVLSIPTTIFFKDGEQVNRVSGAMPKEEIVDLIKEVA